MTYATRNAAIAALRCYSETTRARHTVVRFWSNARNAFRFAHIFA